MPAKSKMTEGEPLTIDAEVRRARVDAVRGLDRDLELVLNSLLDAQARIPRLVAAVENAREVIATATAPAPKEG